MSKNFSYPKTRKGDQVDDFHGTKVADPYRWLEKTEGEEISNWIDNQNLIVDDYLPHSIKVAAKMMHELALEFKNKGHQVTVLTPEPTLNEKTLITDLDGINILFFKSGEIKNIERIKRAINETLLSFYAWKAAKKYLRNNSCGGIVYYSPSIFWGPLVKYLKKRWNCKSYLVLRDIFPQWTVDNGLMKENSMPIKS